MQRSKVELFAAIRRDSRIEGLSVRALARKYGVHRRTVREALTSAFPSPRGVRIPTTIAGFGSYARSHVSGEVQFLGSFRRTRFDSTCEFTRTGNVYGFMVDWCRPLDHPDAPHLYQVEVEYLHSRTRDDAARDAVDEELTIVQNAAAAYLEYAGISHRPGESKLDYMRSLTAMGKQ